MKNRSSSKPDALVEPEISGCRANRSFRSVELKTIYEMFILIRPVYVLTLPARNALFG